MRELTGRYWNRLIGDHSFCHFEKIQIDLKKIFITVNISKKYIYMEFFVV